MSGGRIRTFASSLIVAVALVGCGDATGPDGNGSDDDFEWSGTIAPGDQIEIKGVQGTITASGTSAGQVEVSATKSGTQDDPADVTIEVVQHSGGVTICAVYPDVPGQDPNECLPGLQGNNSTQNNDVQVAFTVSVPAGVVFVGRNVAGAVVANDLQSEALLSTVAGNVSVETTEIAEAVTVSGNVTASIGRADWGRDLEFGAVSGSIDVEVPSNTNAEVVAGTASGTITSDFPLTGPATQKTGTLGSGGPTLTLGTVSGNITLRSGPAS
ncbi:MAG: DUF4097 family beta strand repeat-containing protein [Gemmatimonadales bacterium]